MITNTSSVVNNDNIIIIVIIMIKTIPTFTHNTSNNNAFLLITLELHASIIPIRNQKIRWLFGLCNKKTTKTKEKKTQ